MLYAPPQISPEIKKIEKREDALYLSSDRGKLRLLPMSADARVNQGGMKANTRATGERRRTEVICRTEIK